MLLGKEDALFVSSGTMGNLIAGKDDCLELILRLLLKSTLKELTKFIFIT